MNIVGICIAIQAGIGAVVGSIIVDPIALILLAVYLGNYRRRFRTWNRHLLELNHALVRQHIRLDSFSTSSLYLAHNRRCCSWSGWSGNWDSTRLLGFLFLMLL